MLLVLQVPLAASAALLVAAVAASAQGQPAPPLLLPPVVVESSTLLPERTRTEEQAREEIDRTPGGVEIVPQQAVQESRGANLKDVLDFVPGVLIRPRFGAADESQFSIRGSSLRNNFHQRGVNILIDGFPYGNADGFSDFESLELQTTKYLEVYKGANALRFGGNTLGGAVNLVTKTGRDAGLVESFVEGGSYGFFKGYVGTGQVYGPLDGRRVLMEQGIIDHYILPRIANTTSLSLKLDLALPARDDDPGLSGQQRLADLLQFSGGEQVTLPASGNLVVQHAGDGVQDAHEIIYQLDGPKHQYRCFLKSWVATGTPVVVPEGAADAPCPSALGLHAQHDVLGDRQFGDDALGPAVLRREGDAVVDRVPRR